MDIRLLPLVPDIPLPYRAPAALRAQVPEGYGVQEQCLPFVAANALGLLLPSPFTFGLCVAAELPAGARAFRPPAPALQAGDERVFYVCDRPESRFEGNAFRYTSLPFEDPSGRRVEMHPRSPGLSFFDRPDQAGLFKLHLPWVLRTPDGIDAVFGPPINRTAPLEVLSGLVECDWYAHPVNLALRKPAVGAVHICAGDVIAQLYFVPREARRPALKLMAPDGPEARPMHNELLQWFIAHQQDRSAYRRLAREHQALDAEPRPL